MLKGDVTRKAIIDSAKKLFYEKGYIAVKMIDITGALGVRSTWITYYFKRKENLVNEIFREKDALYYERILNIVKNDKNPLLIHLIRNVLIFRLLIIDEQTKKFRYELGIKQGIKFIRHDVIYENIIPIIEFYSIKIDEREIHQIVDYYINLNDLTIMNYYDNLYGLSIDQMVAVMGRTIFKGLGIEPGEVERQIKKSFQYADKINLEGLDILK